MADSGLVKFTYFPAPGRAEVPKLCCALAGIEFEEEILTFQSWGGIKPTSQWGSSPWVTMPDGTVKGQSKALGRYFAKKAGLYPTNKLQAAQCDAIYDFCEDILTGVSKKNEADDHKDRKADFAEDGKIRKMFEKLDTYIGEIGSGFAVGNCLSMADVCIFVYANNMTSGFFDFYPKPEEAFKGMDNINAIRALVAGLPQVQARYAADFPGKAGGPFKGFLEAADLKGETKVETSSWEADSDMDGKPIVTYFPLPGRAELTRVLFSLAGIEFEDKMIQFQEWPALKPSVPLGGQLPTLTLPGGTVLTQSIAIARYVAACTGMYPEDPEVAHRTDAIADACVDIMITNFKLGTENAPAWEEGGKCNMLMNKLEAYLTACGGKFAACDEMTWADVFLFVLGSAMGEFACKAAAAFPKFAEFKQAVASNDRLVERYGSLKENPKFAEFIQQSGMVIA